MGMCYWITDLVVFEDNEDPTNTRVQTTIFPSYGISNQQIKWLPVSWEEVFIEGKYVVSWLAATIYLYNKNQEYMNSGLRELLQLHERV